MNFLSLVSLWLDNNYEIQTKMLSPREIRGCLVPEKCKIYNVNYFGMMNCKMLKFSELYLVLSKIQNLLPLWRSLETLLSFCLFLEVKIQNTLVQRQTTQAVGNLFLLAFSSTAVTPKNLF